MGFCPSGARRWAYRPRWSRYQGNSTTIGAQKGRGISDDSRNEPDSPRPQNREPLRVRGALRQPCTRLHSTGAPRSPVSQVQPRGNQYASGGSCSERDAGTLWPLDGGEHYRYRHNTRQEKKRRRAVQSGDAGEQPTGSAVDRSVSSCPPRQLTGLAFQSYTMGDPGSS